MKNKTKKYKRLKKMFTITLILLVVFVGISGYLLYTNYDWIVFKYLMSYRYIYTDTLDTVYHKYLQTDPNGNYFKNFDDLGIALVTMGIRYENNDKYTFLYNPVKYEKYKTYTKNKGLNTETKKINDTTVYMCLTNFSTYSLDMLKENIDMLKQYDNLIIDLRKNYGGRVDIMADISEYFLQKGAIIATNKYRNKLTIHQSHTKQILDFNNILILQSNSTASAAENLIACLNDNLDNVTLVGQTTFGKGIGQLTIPLKEGYAVKATTLRWYSPKGINIHEKGINPDIVYNDNDAIDFATDYLTQTTR